MARGCNEGFYLATPYILRRCLSLRPKLADSASLIALVESLGSISGCRDHRVVTNVCLASLGCQDLNSWPHYCAAGELPVQSNPPPPRSFDFFTVSVF